MLIAFHKPFGIVSQFTPENSAYGTLANFDLPPKVYPIGRLDADLEGLLLLSDEHGLNERLLHPRHQHRRRYWAQIERIAAPGTLKKLESGLIIQRYEIQPCRAWLLRPPPEVPARNPPIRFRKTVAACWIALELGEGKNRQVRRMTAAIGHPTLRLIRVQIGTFNLNPLMAGQWKILSPVERELVFERKLP